MTKAFGCGVATLLIATGFGQAAEVRTVNIDFGNGGAYVGDDGVLSSPGGTFWNEVTVTSPGSGQPGQAFAFQLRDEFGTPFALPALLPSVNSFAESVTSITGSGEGPLSDGLTLLGEGAGFGGIVIRELSSETPIEMVVYFTDPVGDSRPSDVIVLSGVTNTPTSDPIRSTGGSGQFPGLGFDPLLAPPSVPTTIDHVRFTDLTPGPTTIGFPLLPGVVVSVPEDFTAPMPGVAHIAAIQIRGAFVFTPEPGSALLCLTALGMMATRRQVAES